MVSVFKLKSTKSKTQSSSNATGWRVPTLLVYGNLELLAVAAAIMLFMYPASSPLYRRFRNFWNVSSSRLLISFLMWAVSFLYALFPPMSFNIWFLSYDIMSRILPYILSSSCVDVSYCRTHWTSSLLRIIGCPSLSS